MLIDTTYRVFKKGMTLSVSMLIGTSVYPMTFVGGKVYSPLSRWYNYQAGDQPVLLPVKQNRNGMVGIEMFIL